MKIRRRPKHPVRAFRSAAPESVTAIPADATPVDHDFEPNKIVSPYHHTSILPACPPALAPLRWADYIISLPSWETTLLTSVTFVDKTLLLCALRHDPHLYLASDGGAADKKGSFGALLANADMFLLECGGRAYGADPGFFRAEGYGLLTILRLVFHIRYFYFTKNLPLCFTLLCKHLHLLAQVMALYELAPFMLSSNRAIFEIPLEARQLQSKSTLQSFYSWASPIVKLSITKAADLGANFRSIDQYFQRPIPPELLKTILG
jgi:hypothetical protein